MKVLVIKMSSLGDIVHTFPALSDATSHFPDLQIDWVVEEAFSEIPAWHPRVRGVIPVALRRWKKNFKEMIQKKEFQSFLKNLRKESYDYVIDAQGLVKSALIAKLSRGQIISGFDYQSSREGLASVFYQARHRLDPSQHAVLFIRALFAKILGYDLIESKPNFGLGLPDWQTLDLPEIQKPYWVFLHGTSHPNKEWPLEEWIKLAELAVKKGYFIYLPWGNLTEYKRTQVIAACHTNINSLPKLTISQLAGVIAQADAVVGVDTGFLHLSSALNRPTLGIYRATSPNRLFISGKRQAYIQVSHKSGCKNDTPILMGIQASCECLTGIQAEVVFQKICALSKNNVTGSN